MSGGYIGLVSREDVTPEIAPSLFDAKSGEIIGLFESKEGFILIEVFQQIPAVLDIVTNLRIREE